MKCTKCGLREASTEVFVRINDKMQRLCLCDECAEGYRPDMGFESFDMINKLIGGSPMGLLSNLNNLFDAHTTRELVCPECKTTSAEFIKTGFVGCPGCYKAFESIVAQSVKRLQQSDRHVGKTPFGKSDTVAEEARLKAELQDAIDSCNYEKIGIIGDKLSKLVGNDRER